MNPVHAMSLSLQNSYPIPTEAPFRHNNYSDSVYTPELQFYAQQELSSHSTLHSTHGQYQYPIYTPQSTTETEVNRLTRNEVGVGLLNQDNLTRLKDLITACRANPDILYIPELTFFKEYLESLRAKIPDKIDKPKTKYTVSPAKPMMEGEDYLIDIGIMPFKCIHCGKSCKSKKNLKRHMISHTGGDGTYKCNQCDKIFAYSSSLDYHIRAHKGLKPYPCFECDKAFSQKNRLEMHMRTHTGERPYKCNQCGKSFKQYNAHKTHVLTHSEVKPSQCSQCDKSFRNRDQLTKHILRNHSPRERKYKCTECDKAFYNNTSLKMHMKKHPEVKWEIPEDE